jgi:DNA replication and repair protein RecF
MQFLRDELSLPMHFSEIRLSSFRNYSDLSLSFSPGINCLTGNNGEGKTNVLEAVHYLCMTRGWQAKSEKYALKEGEAYFSVEGMLNEGGPELKVQCNYMPPKGKRILVDRRPLDRMSDHIGRIPIVTVLPNDTQLIHGTPGTRRRFMDALICQYSPGYLEALIHYENALTQRNALLVMMQERRSWDPEQVDLWDAQLIPHGMVIGRQRQAFLEAFRPFFLRYFNQIVSEKEQPEINLSTQIKENTPEAWHAALLDSRKNDRYSGRTGTGVHKDDLELSIGGQTVRNFGSQGQQKTFSIALKLAQYDILRAQCAKDPILLLDDIFDKLDHHRLAAIAHLLDGSIMGQVFITDTSLPRMHEVFSMLKHRETRHFQVADAKVAVIPPIPTP